MNLSSFLKPLAGRGLRAGAGPAVAAAALALLPSSGAQAAAQVWAESATVKVQPSAAPKSATAIDLAAA
jgi:hypothetical protein